MKVYFKMAELADLFKAHDVAIVSAERGDASASVNKQNTTKLEARVKASGYSYERATGGFVENQGTKDEKAIDGETSFLIIDENDKGGLKGFAARMGEKFDQDSVLVSMAGKKEGYWLGTTKRKDISPSKGALKRVGTLKPKTRGMYYTKISDGYFTFS